MLTLAFDTATPAVTVAVASGAEVLAETTTVDARRHGELLAAGIDRVLRSAGVTPAELDRVAVGVGPGPFTGLRVGVVTARSLGAALSIPVVGVCTLDVLAYESGLAGEFLVATDARRKEVYWARYSDDVRVAGPSVDRPSVVAAALSRGDHGISASSPQLWPVVGAGPELYPDDFPDARPPSYPSAAALARYVAAGLPTLGPLPLYLRRPDVAEPHPPKAVGAR